MRRLAAAALLGVLATAGGDAAASTTTAPHVETSAVAARVAALVEDAATSAVARRRLGRAARVLRERDVPGLRDDFGRIARVATTASPDIAADATLRDVLRAALADGLVSLDAAAAAAQDDAAPVEPGAGRRRVETCLGRAERDAVEAGMALAAGRFAAAARAASRASRSCDLASSVAARLVERQQNRPAAWKIVHDGLDATLLGVWASPGANPVVWTCGAADDTGPTLLRGEGATWTRVAVPGGEDLWWVAGVPGDGVWTAGTNGAVFRVDAESGAVTDRSTGVDATLFGVWGSGPTDVWAVGGDAPEGGGPRPALLHWDGETWTAADVPEEAQDRVLYKVWGTGPGDVWACGQGGTLLHFDGATWSPVASGTPSTLLTLHGPASGDGRITAVGGPGVGAVIVERDESGVWSPAVLEPGTESLNGVHIPAAGDAWAVGYYSTILRRDAEGWYPASGAPRTQGRHHHAVHIDDTGGIWIAGGDLFAFTKGSLLYFGTRRAL